MFCPECGTKVSDDAIFCPMCGHKFAAPQTSPLPETPVPQQQAAIPDVRSTVAGATATVQTYMDQPGQVQRVFGIASVVVLIMLMLGWLSLNTTALKQLLVLGGSYSDYSSSTTSAASNVLSALGGSMSIPELQSLESLSSQLASTLVSDLGSSSSYATALGYALAPSSSIVGGVDFLMLLWYLSVAGVGASGLAIFRHGLDEHTRLLGVVGFGLPTLTSLIVIIAVNNANATIESALSQLAMYYSSSTQLLQGSFSNLIVATPWVWITLIVSLLACAYCCRSISAAKKARTA